jgi:SOS response regulatory protein OraA/RecX
MASSIKNIFKETKANRVADKIIEVLENNGFQSDKDAARHILLMLVVGSYKASALTRDLTNQSVGETIINEMYTSIKAHFGDHATSKIMKHIFTAIAKYDMMGK